jgi:glutathione S-transferase
VRPSHGQGVCSCVTDFCRLSYNLHNIDILRNTQKEPWFTAINPNGRIPAVTDTFKDGKQIRLFESGAIQAYLVERYDANHTISYAPGTREYHEMNCWVSFGVPSSERLLTGIVSCFFSTQALGMVVHNIFNDH